MRAGWLILTACGRLAFDTGDARNVDTSVGTGDPCNATPDTVALYAFDRSSVGSDATGAHMGSLRGTATTSQGPCGDALALPGTSYLLVPDSPAFDLDTGAIDMFVRVAATPPAPQVLVSRDANGAADGHFLISLGAQGHITARLQRSSNVHAYRCADFVPSSVWIHVGVSFGGTPEQGFRMWIDHVEATLPQVDDFPFLGQVTCGGEHPHGIAGNDNAFVIGGSTYNSIEGAADPVVSERFDGELDQVRVSAIWRDFSRR